MLAWFVHEHNTLFRCKRARDTKHGIGKFPKGIVQIGGCHIYRDIAVINSSGCPTCTIQFVAEVK